jgi:type II secretory pathway component PulJ
MKNVRPLTGFSLVEVMVVIALTVVVGGALSSAIDFFYRSNSYLLQETQAIQNARRGIAYSLADVRQASYGADGSYPVANAATSTMTFYSDTNDDGKVDKVRYYLSGVTLYRGTIAPSGSPAAYTGAEQTYVIADSVRMATSSPIFIYYDHASAPLATPADPSKVASVYVRLTIDVDPNRTPNPLTLTGGATLRNLRQY